MPSGHYKLSPEKEAERRHKISETLKTTSFWKGKHLPLETRERISKTLTGRKLSEEQCIKNSLSHIGLKRSEDTKKKLSESKKGIKNPQYGKTPSIETRLKLSLALQGPKSYRWKGGASFEPYCQKFNNEFRERVRAYFNYQCVECGTIQTERRLEIHHVNSNKQACCDSSTPVFVPLCKSCHGKAGHNTEYWENWFASMITDYYGGKCYFTKEEFYDYYHC